MCNSHTALRFLFLFCFCFFFVFLFVFFFCFVISICFVKTEVCRSSSICIDHMIEYFHFEIWLLSSRIFSSNNTSTLVLLQKEGNSGLYGRQYPPQLLQGPEL